MAAIAAGPLVRTRQGEIGKCVIEGFAVELDDIEGAPLVFGVAGLALALQGFWVAAVKIARRLPIRNDRLMARQAEAGLRFLRERLMTALAGFLQIRMRTDQWSRHDQFLEDALCTCHHG